MEYGRIMKALSGFYYVQVGDELITCKGRGVFRNQNITPYVGDFVALELTAENEGYIQKIESRQNQLKRPPIANVTQGIVVNSAISPNFSPQLIDRFIVLLESHHIKPLLYLSKLDLIDDFETIKIYQSLYESLGYKVILSTDLKENKDLLHDMFKGEVSVLVGQSGVGKSTFLNEVDPLLNLETNAISEKLGRGKHTTRHVELVPILGGLIADTPGFSSLELNHIAAEDLRLYFKEIAAIGHDCKFRSCLHLNEPKCTVKNAVEQGDIHPSRYKHYKLFLNEIQNKKVRY